LAIVIRSASDLGAAAGRDGHRSHGREVAHRVIAELGRQQRVQHHGGGGGQQQHRAVGRRVGQRLGADGGVRARLVVYDDDLIEILAHQLGERTRQRIGAAAGCVGHDQVDRLVGHVGRAGHGGSQCAGGDRHAGKASKEAGQGQHRRLRKGVHLI
jgi:hypothetical protein